MWCSKRSGCTWTPPTTSCTACGQRRSSDSITNMTRAQVHRYYRRAYVPANLVIAAAGNLDHDRLVELVGEVFGGIEDPGTPLRKSVPPLRPEPASAFTKKPTEQVHLVLGGPGLARGDDRRARVPVPQGPDAPARWASW